MIIYGINPVLEALRADRVRRLRIGGRHDKRIDEVLSLARRKGVAVERVEARALERVARGAVHQGIVAEVDQLRDYSIAELVSGAAPDRPLIVVLDGVEDPHNVGAVLRTVDAAGAHGVVRQTRHAASLDGVAMKASAGAAAYVRVATVVNIARAIEELKEAGVWTVGLAGEARERLFDVDLTLPTAIVLGAEGTGLRRLVRQRCDRVVSIPLKGAVASLNVAAAAAVALFEASRQRLGGVSQAI